MTRIAPWPDPPFGCTVCEGLPASSTVPIDYPPLARLVDVERADRIRGVLIGGALGDAAGRLREQDRSIAWDRLTPGCLETGGATQLTLFTAEGLLRMHVRANLKGMTTPGVVQHAYHRWLFTQRRLPLSVRAHWESGAADGWPDGWLVRRHELHADRGGFSGTVAALGVVREVDLFDLELRPRVNHSDGAGAVVRSSPIGMLVSHGDAFELAVRIAGFTHGGATAYLGAGFVATAVAGLIDGVSLPDALTRGRNTMIHWTHNARLLPVMDAALGGREPPSEMTHGASALYWAVQGLNREVSLADLLESVVANGGTAAATVAGALWGGCHGASRIPASARAATDLSAAIDEIADGVIAGHRAWVMSAAASEPRSDEPSAENVAQRLWARFPGW